MSEHHTSPSDDWRERLDAHTPRSPDELDALAAELRAEREAREVDEQQRGGPDR